MKSRQEQTRALLDAARDKLSEAKALAILIEDKTVRREVSVAISRTWAPLDHAVDTLTRKQKTR